VERDGSGVSTLVGLDGFVGVRPAARRRQRRVVAGGGDQRGSCLVPSLRCPGGRSWPAAGGGARSAAGGSAGGAGVGQAPVALPRAGVPARTWSEETDQIAPQAVLSERARAEIARRVGPAEHSVAQAPRDFGVSWHAAMAAVRDHGRPRVDHLARLGAPKFGHVAGLAGAGRSRRAGGGRRRHRRRGRFRAGVPWLGGRCRLHRRGSPAASQASVRAKPVASSRSWAPCSRRWIP
jgi:hypothetical protein